MPRLVLGTSPAWVFFFVTASPVFRLCGLGFVGAWSGSDARKDALLALSGGVKEVLSALKAGAGFVKEKNLPLGSFALNGVLSDAMDISQSLNNVLFQVRLCARSAGNGTSTSVACWAMFHLMS